MTIGKGGGLKVPDPRPSIATAYATSTISATVESALSR